MSSAEDCICEPDIVKSVMVMGHNILITTEANPLYVIVTASQILSICVGKLQDVARCCLPAGHCNCNCSSGIRWAAYSSRVSGVKQRTSVKGRKSGVQVICFGDEKNHLLLYCHWTKDHDKMIFLPSPLLPPPTHPIYSTKRAFEPV